MNTFLLIAGLLAVLSLSIFAISVVKRCRLPHRKPRIWKDAAAVVTFAMLAASASAAESFLSNVSLAPIGVMNVDPGTGAKEWGAGLKLDYQLNKTVSLNLGLIAYEGDNWQGPAIDETPVEVKAVLFGSADKGASLYAVGGLDRSWRADDWGMKGGLGLEFRLAKRLSVFGEATYDVWRKGTDRISVPFGFRLDF